MSTTDTETRAPGAMPQTAGHSAKRRHGLFVKVGDGRWYAIPPGMAESFRMAGAEVVRADELPC